MARYLPRRTFGLVLTVLGIGTVIGVAAAEILHHPSLVPIVVGAAVAIGIIYIVVLAETVPEPAPTPVATDVTPSPPDPGSVPASPPATPPAVMIEPTEPYEPYYDPVEEADRLDAQKSRGEPPPSEGQDPK